MRVAPGPREGALIGYGPDYSDIYRRAGSYISRILNGENPADLPVQNPVRFQLVINQDTASALNLNVPDALLMSAHEVIQK